MFFTKKPLFRTHKNEKSKYVAPEICMNGKSDVKSVTPSRKISDREIALGYMFW